MAAEPALGVANGSPARRAPVPGRPYASTTRLVGPNDAWEVAGGRLPANALVLALDTSTRVGGVALSRGSTVLGEETWLAGGSQTAHVLPAAVRLWERAGHSPRDLQAVVVATGPGSFTGLRVGASLGKGFAAALGIPLAGVPTLDVIAYQHREAAARLVAVVDAGRGHLYAATYRRWRGQLRRGDPYRVLTVDELADSVAGDHRPTLVCGELAAAEVALLRRTASGRAAGGVRIASPAANLRRPAFLAELGSWQLAAHGAADPARLEPIYLKRTAAGGQPPAR